MNARWLGIVAAMGAAVLAGAAPAQTLRRESILDKQEKQQQVRAMARELVSGIVDLQLRQLEENGMEKTDLYRELRSMRANLDKLVEAEMPRVVALLMRLLEEPPDTRPATFLAARQKSREVLIQLLIERQNLLRRLRMAELAAQVRKLIASESKLYDTTRALPEMPQARREEATLAAVQDQRDIRELYVRLVDLLREVPGWGGPAAAEAAKALAVLTARKTDAEFDAAIRHLEETRYPQAAASQEAILKALADLLRAVERAQGLLTPESSRDSVEEHIRQLAERQKALRVQTEQADLTQTSEAQKLAHEQTAIDQQLEELLRAAEHTPELHESLQEAEESAEKAAEHIFEGQKPEALAQQNRVVENLEKAAEQARQAGSMQQPLPDASRMVEDLLAVREDLRKIENQQKETTPLAEQKPQEAGPREQQIGARLAEAPKGRQLPAAVGAAIEEARQAAERAAQAMHRPEAAARRQAARNVEQAIQRAIAEVEQALADLRREQLAGQAAQLAQAAAKLEKAAAQEREIAKAADQAARSQGLHADEARRLGQQQSGVQGLADKASQALEHSAPQAARLAGEAKPAMEQTAQELQSAQERPGEGSKPAAATAARQASQAADKLAQAAQEARKAAAAAAEQLAQEAARQIQAALNAEQGVENALAQTPRPIAQRMERLARAAEEVQKAQAEQARAAGHPQAAAAMELASGIRKALAAQDAADRAAEAVAQHQPGATLNQAAARQQDVAAMAAQLGQHARAATPQTTQAKPEPPVAQALDRAERSARQAAKEILTAKPDSAAQARAQTRGALQQALQLAESQANEALHAPPGPRDMEAQARTGQAIARAEELVQPDAPEAEKPLHQAAESSQSAQEHGRQGNQPATDKAQAATQRLLEEAAQRIAQAMDRLAHQAAEQMAGQSQAAQRLADQAAPVDAGATGALHQAENQAAQAAQQPAAVPAAVPAFEQAMHQAAAELAQRRGELAQQQALAQRLAQAAGQPDAGRLMAQLAQQMAGEMGPDTAAEPAAPRGPGATQQPGQRPSDQASPQGTGGMARAGQQALNQPPLGSPAQPTSQMPQGDSRTAEAPNPPPEGMARRVREEPWHADLPPDVRSAIRANAQRRPPRGYEEKLERYFKNID